MTLTTRTCPPTAFKVFSDLPLLLLHVPDLLLSTGMGVDTVTFTVYFLVCLKRWLFRLCLNSLSFYAGF